MILPDTRSSTHYDRLNLNFGADYYVTFGGVQVGRLQAFGLGKCLAARKAENPVIAELNGSSTDDNAIQYQDPGGPAGHPGR